MGGVVIAVVRSRCSDHTITRGEIASDHRLREREVDVSRATWLCEAIDSGH